MGLFNHFPYTNFHELNIDWAIEKIKALLTEGETLYTTLENWKDATDASLAAWKTQTMTDLNTWKTETQAAITSWESGVVTDITAQFTAIQTALATWQAQAEAAWASTKNAAEAAQAAAEAAADTAEAAAASLVIDDSLEVPNAAADAAIVGAKFTQVEDALDYIVDSDTHNVPVAITSIPGINDKSGWNASARVTTPIGIQMAENDSYDTYWFVATADSDIYFTDPSQLPTYVAITVADDFVQERTSGSQYILECESAGTRYRKSDSNLPDSVTKLHVSVGTCVAITVTAGQAGNVDLYGYATETTYSPTTEFSDAITSAIESEIQSLTPRKKYVQYHTASDPLYSEYLDIYLPIDTGYLCYEFVHNESVSRNADIWRINNMYVCDADLTNPVKITTTGEYEHALHLKDRGDFSGGINHGDEIMTSISLYLDCVSTQISSLTTLTEFNTLSIVETSSLYDPADGTTLIAEVGSEHRFEKDLTIMQSVKWKVAAAVTTCYMAMLPIAKAYSKQVFTDSNFTIFTMTGERYSTPDARRATIIDEDNSIYMHFNTPVYPNQNSNTFFTTDNTQDQSGTYNKCYYSITKEDGSYTTTVNEIWTSTTEYILH